MYDEYDSPWTKENLNRLKKAANNAAASDDCMLDSEDCIMVLRGTWKGNYLHDQPQRKEPEQEPVAWVEVIDPYEGPYYFHGKELLPKGKHYLYTTPPQLKPLTDEQIDNATRKQVDALLDHIYEYGTAAEGINFRVRDIARATEAAHDIKE